MRRGDAGLGVIVFFYFRKHGQELDKMEIWPPQQKEKDQEEQTLEVPFEPGVGGSTGAGRLTGIMEVRKALSEKEWAEASTEEGQQEQPDEEE